VYITPNILRDFMERSGVQVSLSGDGGLKLRDVRLMKPGALWRSGSALAVPWKLAAQIPPDGVCALVPEGSKLPPETGSSAILSCRCVPDRIFDLAQDCFSAMNAWDELLHQKILEGCTLDELLRISGEIFNNPTMLDDPGFRVLARNTAPFASQFRDQEWAFVRDNGYHSPEYVNTILDSPEYQRSLAEPVRPFIQDYPFLSHPFLCSPVRRGGAVVGFFSVIGVCVPLTPGLEDLCEYFTSILSGVMSEKPLAVREGRRDPGYELLADALDGRITNPERLQTAFFRAGISPGQRSCVAFFAPEEPSPSDRFMFLRISDKLVKQMKNCCPVVMEDGIALLFREEAGPSSRKDVLGISEEFLRFSRMVLGFSLSFTKPDDIRFYCRQARAAAKYGPLAKPGGRIFHYEQAAVYDLLNACGDREARSVMAHPAVFLLAEHDRTKGTAFLPTLRAVLRHRCDTAAAAAELYIHRNSLYYRIKQITELTGLSLREEAVLEHLSLSLKIYDMDRKK